MTLTSIASVLACIVFVGAMLHVIATDMRDRRIRNWLVGTMAGLYAPLALAAGLSGAEIAAGLLAALLVFASGFGCFAAGWIGGGDAKLAPVCVLWLGADQALPFLALISVLGGGLALALVVTGALRRRRTAAFAGALGTDPLASGAPPRPRLVLPYGPALALAGLILLSDSPWANAL